MHSILPAGQDLQICVIHKPIPRLGNLDKNRFIFPIACKINAKPAVGSGADRGVALPGRFPYFGILYIFRLTLFESAVQYGDHSMQRGLLCPEHQREAAGDKEKQVSHSRKLCGKK
jgi:hypothetical protein